jgi:hypothetical protein
VSIISPNQKETDWRMKRSALILGVILSLAASACAPQATSTVNPVGIQHTAEAAAFTMIAQTEEAIPTATLVPPTETPSPTPVPTLTSIASPTSDVSPTQTQTAVSYSSGSTQDNCNKALTSWDGPTAKLNLANETKPQGVVTLSLYVMTELGECGYLSQQFEASGSLSGPVGQYSAGAFVDGKKDFRVFGDFRIVQGSWTIVVNNESIVAQGGCFPNC